MVIKTLFFSSVFSCSCITNVDITESPSIPEGIPHYWIPVPICACLNSASPADTFLVAVKDKSSDSPKFSWKFWDFKADVTLSSRTHSVSFQVFIDTVLLTALSSQHWSNRCEWNMDQPVWRWVWPGAVFKCSLGHMQMIFPFVRLAVSSTEVSVDHHLHPSQRLAATCNEIRGWWGADILTIRFTNINPADLIQCAHISIPYTCKHV